MESKCCAELARAYVCASLGRVPTMRRVDDLGAGLDILKEDDPRHHPRRERGLQARGQCSAIQISRSNQPIKSAEAWPKIATVRRYRSC